MTVTEIIEGLEVQQKTSNASEEENFPVINADVYEVCRLSKHLALHVQQLEIDMEKMRKERQ
jgi:hypothetical protein